MPGGVLIFAEQREGELKKTALEAASTARRLAGELGGVTSAVLIGSSLSGMAETLGGYGVEKVYKAEDSALEKYDGGRYAAIFTEAVSKADPAVVLIPASSMGKDLAPRLTAALGVGLASECTELAVESGKLLATRPVYAGKAYIKVKLTGNRQIATLRPNVFAAEESGGPAPEIINLALLEPSVPVSELKHTAGERPELTEASIIVSGGRGVGAPEKFDVIESLADKLNAAVGASRAVVDAGWRPHSDQVGQTGKTVSPNLYIACGISGAIQHLAGISSSKVIVAVNKDPEAPIFKAASYGIVGDLFDVVPRMVEEISKINA